MKRRRNNEGAYGTCKRGKYTYKFYRFPDGHQIYAKTSAELELKKKNYEENMPQNISNPILDKKYILLDYCNLWLATKKKDITPRVYDEYEEVIKNRIGNFKTYNIGLEQIHNITPQMINNYLSALSQRYSKASIDRVWTIMNQVIKYAISEGVITSFDFTKIRKPKEIEVKVKKKDVPFVTEEDMERIWQETLNPKYGTAAKVIAFIMYSGLRVSEACALTWDCVAEDYSYIKVKKSQALVKQRDAWGNIILNENGKPIHKIITKGTKTEAGERSVPLPDRAKRILQELDCTNQTSNIFTNAKHHPFDKDQIRKSFNRIIVNAKCSTTDYTPHSLRHGYGSLLLKKGVDIKIVSELLGHSDVTTTYNIYIGILKDDKINAIKSVFDSCL